MLLSPREKLGTSPGLGFLLKRPCPWGRGRGKSKTTRRSFEVRPDGATRPRREDPRDCLFPENSQEIVADWLEKKNL